MSSALAQGIIGRGPDEAPGGFGDQDASEQKVLIVPIDEPLTANAAGKLISKIEDRIEDDRGFKTIVFRLGVGSEDLEGCQKLASYIFDQLRTKVDRTVAWLPEITEPLAGAILIVMACKDVVMGSEAILSALPDPGDPTATKAEFDEAFAEKLKAYAKKNAKPTLLAHALIDTDHDPIVMVVLNRHEDTLQLSNTWDTEGTITIFRTKGEYDNLPIEITRREREAEQQTFDRGTVLRFNASDAKRVKLVDIRKETANQITLVSEALNLNIPLDNVNVLGQGSIKARHPTIQAVVNFFNYPLVRFFLILCGCLGLLLEFKLPGTFVPAVLGLSCFVLLFVTSSFPVTGMVVGTASVFEIVLFFIGIILLGVELFLLPGVVVFALTGGALCAVSLVLTMVPPDTAPILQDQMTVKGAIMLLILGFGAGIASFIGLVLVLPKTPFLGQRGIISHASIDSVATADTTQEAQNRIANLVGKTGVTDTMLRPSGKVLLDDGQILDVISEGGFIDKGEKVVVKGSSGSMFIVTLLPDSKASEPEEPKR